MKIKDKVRIAASLENIDEAYQNQYNEALHLYNNVKEKGDKRM